MLQQIRLFMGCFPKGWIRVNVLAIMIVNMIFLMQIFLVEAMSKQLPLNANVIMQDYLANFLPTLSWLSGLANFMCLIIAIKFYRKIRTGG